MTRAFRYYGKKRGHRRTGSPVWGVAVEAAFSTVFFLAGCGVLAYMLFHQFAPHWRVNQKFVETACKVLDTHIEEIEGQGGPAFQPKLKIEYAAKGEIETTADYDIGNTKFNNREDAQDILDRFEIYSTERNNLYPCWYDPADPYTVVMTRDYPRWMWLAFTVPISFIILGAGGLIHTVFGWGKSVERRSARKRNGMERDARVAGGEGDRRFPGIPAGADLTNSPGTKLKYRLPESGSTGWRLFGLFAACVFWNGIVALFVWDSARGHLAGNPDWFGTLFLIPFVLIGLAIIVYFLRQLLVVAGIGPTRIEISAHPLRPGGRYVVNIANLGRKPYRSLSADVARAWDEARALPAATGDLKHRVLDGGRNVVRHESAEAVDDAVSAHREERVVHDSHRRVHDFLELDLHLWPAGPGLHPRLHAGVHARVDHPGISHGRLHARSHPWLHHHSGVHHARVHHHARIHHTAGRCRRLLLDLGERVLPEQVAAVEADGNDVAGAGAEDDHVVHDDRRAGDGLSSAVIGPLPHRGAAVAVDAVDGAVAGADVDVAAVDRGRANDEVAGAERPAPDEATGVEVARMQLAPGGVDDLGSLANG